MSNAPALILTYHRVADGPDPLLQCVTPSNFEAQMTRLPELADVVPLRDLDTPSSHRRVAITFDDGYADNADVAAPMLRAAGNPATFFVPSRVVDDDREHWWDRLEHLVMDAELDDFLAAPALGLRVDVRTADGRARALKALNRRLRTRPLREIEPVLDQLGSTNGHACARHRLMPAASIAALAGDELFEIGSHAATHTMLTALQGDELVDEVSRSRETLSGVTTRPVTSLAYPYGTPESYSREAVALARRSGYERACANTVGRIGRRPKRFALPRCMVYDWDSDEFAAQVNDWFETA